jgi:hypothetical protein
MYSQKHRVGKCFFPDVKISAFFVGLNEWPISKSEWNGFGAAPIPAFLILCASLILNES